MGELHRLADLSIKKKQARYYWRMTYCSYSDLARQIRLPIDLARRWVDQFVKEKTQEKQNG